MFVVVAARSLGLSAVTGLWRRSRPILFVAVAKKNFIIYYKGRSLNAVGSFAVNNNTKCFGLYGFCRILCCIAT